MNRSACRYIVACMTAVIATAGVARAQDSLSISPVLTAVTLGLPGAGDETVHQLFTFGVVWNAYRPNSIRPELAIGTMPYALVNGLAAIGARIGVAVPAVVSGSVILIPSAGVGLAMVANSDGGGASSAYAGAAAVVGTGRRGAFRAGATWHRFSDVEGTIWLLEAGLVLPFRRSWVPTSGPE